MVQKNTLITTENVDTSSSDIKKRTWLKAFVFLSCFTGFLLQLIAFGNIWIDLCDTELENRSYCEGRNDTSNNYTIQEAEGVGKYREFRTFLIVVLVIDLFTFTTASCKIKCCVEHICVPCWANVWEHCVCCGNGWFIMAGIGTCLNMISIIYVSVTIPFADMIQYIIGFRFVFANMWFGFVQLALWCAYLIHRRSCCPDAAYFLGSNRRLSECEIEMVKVITEKTVNEQGTVIKEREVGRVHLGTRKVQPACIYM